MTRSLGQLVQSYFADYLMVQKGLRLSTVRSYRDTMRLFLRFVSKQTRHPISRLSIQDLTFEQALSFLKYLEEERGNQARTRNQRRAALYTFFEYVALRMPEMLATCQQIAAIPVKRSPPCATHYLEREEIKALLQQLPRQGYYALRDRTLLLFLYNTGARVQEVADLRIEHLDLDAPATAHLHGKGDKWRICPLWEETVKHLVKLLAQRGESVAPTEPVFCSRHSAGLTRFGIYKIVRRHAAGWDTIGADQRRVTPHLFRHTAAVHLLESGVEVNVIRGWLGHVNLDTTNRYTELTLRSKAEALRACEPNCANSVGVRGSAVWKDDKALLDWLTSL
jgi:integrase/recombinase XerD